MITVILGDPHLGKGTSIGKPGIGSALNSRIADQFNILEWVLDTAMDHMATTIVITGDIFQDPKPHPTIVALFISWLKKCTDNNMSVHIISGNHDVLRSGQFYMSALDIVTAADIDDVHVYRHVSTLHTHGASFTFLPFRDRRSFNVDSNTAAMEALKAKLPYELSEIENHNAKVVIGHLAIEGSIPVGDEIDDMSNELFCPVDMFNGYDFVWMGHVHKPQVLGKSPHVAHIGSMDLSDFGEADHTKILIVFDPKKSEPYKYIEIPTRPLRQISISVPENILDTTSFVLNNLKSKFNNKLNKSIVRVNIILNNQDVINVDRTAVESCLNDLGTFHVTRINEERKVVPIKKNATTDNIDNTVNESTAIKMFADSNVDQELKNDFIAFANSIVKECSTENQEK